jgi:hypothetical protein
VNDPINALSREYRGTVPDYAGLEPLYAGYGTYLVLKPVRCRIPSACWTMPGRIIALSDESPHLVLNPVGCRTMPGFAGSDKCPIR